MSRPALYLVFPSKEDILRAVVEHVITGLLAEIRQGIASFATAEEKLIFAFDVWNVRGFEVMQASPDAKDLYESSRILAGEATARSVSEFVGIDAETLEPLAKQKTNTSLSPVQIARILVNAVPGFKMVAKTIEEFRGLIAGLITIVLASLNNTEKRRKGSPVDPSA